MEILFTTLETKKRPFSFYFPYKKHITKENKLFRKSPFPADSSEPLEPRNFSAQPAAAFEDYLSSKALSEPMGASLDTHFNNGSRISKSCPAPPAQPEHHFQKCVHQVECTPGVLLGGRKIQIMLCAVQC